jgi:hypothetical protein
VRVVATTGSGLRAADRRAAFETALIVVGLLVLLLVLPHALAGDDGKRFADVEQLIHHGHLTSSRYSLVGPLASAPFLLLGEVVGSPAWWAARFNVFLVAAGLAAAFVLTRGRVAPGLLRTFALVLLFASFLTDRLRDYGTEVFTGTLLVLGTMAVVSGRYRRLGWAAIVLGVVNMPAAIAGLALVAVARALQTRRFRPLLAPLLAAILIMLEAWVRRGGPLTTGYEGDHGVRTLMPYSGRPGFSYPFVLGIVSILFSFGRGLVFFMPGLLFWFGDRTRRLVPGREFATLLLLFVAGLVLVYAKWWAWYGGESWGPRYFVLAAVPASLFVAVRLRAGHTSAWDAAATVAVLGLSAWVAVTGALENSWHDGVCSQNNFRIEYVCWYVPDFSSLWWPVTHHPPLTAATLCLTGYCVAVFAYLAAPPLRRIGHDLAALPSSWAHGWRF